MKIDGTTKTSPAPLNKDLRGSAPEKTAAATDDIHLSGLAAQLRANSDESSFDAARVAEIKSAIAEGRFTINADAIADRLIASAKELIDSQRQA